jgi:thiol:disulfide interchange protein DsbD
MKRLSLAAAGLALLLLGAGGAGAQLPDLGGIGGIGGVQPPADALLRFDVRVAPADPFADGNKVGAKLKEVRRGEVFRLTITGTLEKGYHTYPLTRRTPEQSDAGLSTLTYTTSDTFQPLWPVQESEGEFVKEGKEVLLEHSRPFTWSQDIFVKPTARPGSATLSFKIHSQACARNCTWVDKTFDIPLTVSAEPPGPVPASLQTRLGLPQPEPTVVAVPGRSAPRASGPEPKRSASTSTGPQASASRSDTSAGGLWGSIAKAILGGLVSLLTPCVFPMIPITVSFFLKQAEKQQHRALTMAGVYSLTIVAVLAAGGLALVGVLVQISQHYVTNYALAAVFLFFALSLLGMYDITLPSWLTELTSSREGRGGLVGVVFMALTFSIISFACVGPIYGGFISLEATSQSGSGSFLRLFLPVLAFSAAFASPFFVLALFPTLLRSLPRSGSWMNSVKVVMGFLELAAVFKFLRAAELNLLGKSNLFTFDLTLGIYVALSLACGLYLLNVYRLPHDHDAPETIGVPRLLFSLAFLSLGVYLIPGLFKTEDGDSQRPRGEVFLWVRSFLLPDPTPAGPPSEGTARARGQRLVWLTNYPDALRQAAEQNKPVFIDFTGLG